MKKDDIIYWATTGFIGVISILGGIGLLTLSGAIGFLQIMGFPHYFRIELAIFKMLGGLALLLPGLPRKIKEWAYAGLFINITSAIIAFNAINADLAFYASPVIAMAALVVSYWYFSKTSARSAVP